jgi:hypothetical protein
MLLFILGCMVGGSGGFIIAGLLAASKKEMPKPEIKRNKPKVKENNHYVLKRSLQ